MRKSLVVAIMVSLCAVGICSAQPSIPDGFWDHGGFPDPDGIFDPPPLPPPTILAEFDFEGCSTDGWTSHDAYNQGPFFHVDDFAGVGGTYSPLAGSKSLWCGVRSSASAAPGCSYMTAPGYGNRWNQTWTTKTCITVTGNVDVTFTARWDVESVYDYVLVEHTNCPGTNWTPANGTIGIPEITGIGGPTAATFSFSGHTGSVKVRLRVFSDTGYSDEDGEYPTSGAIVVDNLSINSASGTALPLETFESETVGALQSNDWEAGYAGFGDFAHVYPGTTQPQDDPTYTNMSCLWAFTFGSSDNYACGGHATTAAVPMGPTNDLYIRNEIWSPEIVFSGSVADPTFLEFDVYRDLPLDNLVFYYWQVRERLVGAACWGRWQDNASVYYSNSSLWHRGRFDLTPFLSPAFSIARIQVALGVTDMKEHWGGSIGSGACHSHAPLFDNVTVGRGFGRSHVARALSFFEDGFPDNGTLGGTMELDGAEGDAFRIQITDAAFPIDYATPNDPNSGKAVFLHVKNIGNKAGAVISGGGLWPYVPSMSDQVWTVLQMAETGGLHEYNVDLNDQLYTPGDVIEYFVSSRTTDGAWSYWSRFTGTASLADVKANPMEATCLPKPSQPNDPRALYVDGYSGLGAQPLIENTMDQLGLNWDRFDRSEPLMSMFNGLGNRLTNIDFLQNYNVVVWDTGDLADPFEDGDFVAMYLYLASVPGAKLYICGSHAAKAIATSNDQGAQLLRSQFLNFNLVTDNHLSLGLPFSPKVTGVPQSSFDETLVAFSKEGTSGDMDVISATASSTAGMYFEGNPNAGALIYQETPVNAKANTMAEPARVVLSTFSLHTVRDDTPSGISDRVRHLDEVLTKLGAPGSPPTGVVLQAPDFLSQNHPNPFNPTTTIEYSLSTGGPVSLRIYDVSGRLVRTLIDEVRVSAGPARVEWNGRDEHGVSVASGVYFYRLAAPGFQSTRKMVLLK